MSLRKTLRPYFPIALASFDPNLLVYTLLHTSFKGEGEGSGKREKAACHIRALTLGLPLGLSSWELGSQAVCLSAYLCCCLKMQCEQHPASESSGKQGPKLQHCGTPAGTQDRTVHFKMLFDTSLRAYFIAVSKPGIKHRVYRMSPAATKLMHSCKSPS